jgi:hypothetical protein
MKIKGYAAIASSGYDPQKGKHIKDPYLGDTPTLGGCRPDIREQVVPGDCLAFISGKIPGESQYIFGLFEVEKKISALAAYKQFPQHRLRLRDDGQLTGNIIVDANGKQHPLDNHTSFERRIKNYVVGCNPLYLTEPDEIANAREQTIYVLQNLLGKAGTSPFQLIGRGKTRLDFRQIQELRDWMLSLKTGKKVSNTNAGS